MHSRGGQHGLQLLDLQYKNSAAGLCVAWDTSPFQDSVCANAVPLCSWQIVALQARSNEQRAAGASLIDSSIVVF